jgi:hypothetical protein
VGSVWIGWGSIADASGADFLRLQNLDVDILPDGDAILRTQRAAGVDADHVRGPAPPSRTLQPRMSRASWVWPIRASATCVISAGGLPRFAPFRFTAGGRWTLDRDAMAGADRALKYAIVSSSNRNRQLLLRLAEIRIPNRIWKSRSVFHRSHQRRASLLRLSSGAGCKERGQQVRGESAVKARPAKRCRTAIGQIGSGARTQPLAHFF